MALIACWCALGAQPMPPPLAERPRTQAEALQERIRYGARRVDNLKREERSVLGELSLLAEEIRTLERQESELQNRQEELILSMQEVSERLESLEGELTNLRESAHLRARALYMAKGDQRGWISTSATDRVARRQFRDRLHFVMKHDRDLIDRIRSVHVAEERAKSEMIDLNTEAEAAEALREAQQEEKLQKTEAQKGLLAAIRKERWLGARVNTELERARRVLKAEMGRTHGFASTGPSSDASFASQRGQLPWPTRGRLEAPFGHVVELESGLVVRNRGILIRAQSGLPVLSVSGGRVAYSGVVAGFGRTLVIDHGDGFHTVYGHLARSFVSQGDEVGSLMKVAEVGLEPLTGKPGLYFEVRRSSEAVDPLEWLSG
jgi:murein hydrolase activator